jgi:hypothetical protein
LAYASQIGDIVIHELELPPSPDHFFWGISKNHPYLVAGLEHEFYDFPYIGNFIIPTDEFIFFRGVGQPPTSYIFPHEFI